jgi:hypothetical protein
MYLENQQGNKETLSFRLEELEYREMIESERCYKIILKAGSIAVCQNAE